jgi:hypothetical protein
MPFGWFRANGGTYVAVNRTVQLKIEARARAAPEEVEGQSVQTFHLRPHLVSGRIECKSIPNHDDLIDHLPKPDTLEDHEGKATGVTACRSQTLFCRMCIAELLKCTY